MMRLETVELAQMDALMLTGGGDISREFLCQPIPDPFVIVDCDLARDEWEFRAAREALAAGKPLLAICRGLQVINVTSGGTLLLDIPNHDIVDEADVHPLRYSAAASHRFGAVNSTHHQALDRLGDGLEVEGWSAIDGIVEQVRLINYGFGVGVQYHPERHDSYRPLFVIRGLLRSYPAREAMTIRHQHPRVRLLC